MRRPKKNSGVWDFLDKKGLLENSSDEEIKIARAAYWREYSRLRMQKTRKAQKRQFSISFAANEIAHVQSASKAYGYKTIQDYIRACTFAAMQKANVIPHSSTLAEILQILRLCDSKLEAIKNNESKGLFKLGTLENDQKIVLNEVEQRIMEILQRPRSLKEIIIENLKINPKAIELITSIIKDYVSDQKYESPN